MAQRHVTFSHFQRKPRKSVILSVPLLLFLLSTIFIIYFTYLAHSVLRTTLFKINLIHLSEYCLRMLATEPYFSVNRDVKSKFGKPAMGSLHYSKQTNVSKDNHPTQFTLRKSFRDCQITEFGELNYYRSAGSTMLKGAHCKIFLESTWNHLIFVHPP